MFHEIDAVLKAILATGLDNAVAETNINFDTPCQRYKPNPMSINCFLYEINENEDMKSNEWSYDKGQDGIALKHRAPFWLSCEYYITAWADTVDDEHRLLGQIFTALLAYEVNPESVLRDVDIDTRVENARLKLNRVGYDKVSSLWKLCGIQPRLGLGCTVISSVAKQKPQKVPLVKQKILKVQVENEIKTQ
ncbi:MAG: DUF4255 domain-containing protein [Gammaproteobacteria bacterium]|nr:DUF4255 domain-containing protein [Gammaproteobacteria bacterium]